MEILYFIFCYLFGSLPFGLILTKISGLGDIRNIGSGNIGATNVLRTGNKFLAALTVAFDSGKGLLTVFIYYYLFEPIAFIEPTITETGPETVPSIIVNHYILLLCGFFVILGHSYPIWLNFKGGKSYATTLGVLVAAVPLVGLIAIASWFATAFAFKISSLAALVSLFIAPIAAYFLYGPAAAAGVLIISIFVYWRHKDNIERLLKGEEGKINLKKT